LLIAAFLTADTGRTEGKNAAVDSVVKGNNAFAVDLYTRIKDKEGNIFFSPYSISTAFAMTYGGAKTETAKQIAKVLHFNLDQTNLATIFNQLQTGLNNVQKKHPVQLLVANSLWPQEKYPFLPGYTEMIGKQYGATVNPLDYEKDPEKARNTINSWIEEKTTGKIKEMIGPADSQLPTVMTLVNAIYFKGSWLIRFDKEKTIEDTFIISGTKQVKVPMMRQEGIFPYHGFSDVQVVELPYAGKALSMIIVLPRKVGGLDEIEQNLSYERIQKWTSHFSRKDLMIQLPRFTITQGFNLIPHLKKLGMNDPFVFGKADFSGMTVTKDITEEGTVAAAATAVRMPEEDGKEICPFQHDHPFLDT
jgi:serpin B